jgi:hypothetical protein
MARHIHLNRVGGAHSMGMNNGGNVSMILAMMSVPSVFRFRRWPQVLVCLLLGLVGCQVVVISSYDPELDRAATSLQKKMDAFLTGLETHAGQPQAKYAWDSGFYNNYLVELRSMLLRAQSQGANEITARELTLMMENLQQLRLAHEAGSLTLPTIQATRDLFNQGWQAIIGREIAKRRGENLP